jgi:hypothetical protein
MRGVPGLGTASSAAVRRHGVERRVTTRAGQAWDATVVERVNAVATGRKGWLERAVTTV